MKSAKPLAHSNRLYRLLQPGSCTSVDLSHATFLVYHLQVLFRSNADKLVQFITTGKKDALAELCFCALRFDASLPIGQQLRGVFSKPRRLCPELHQYCDLFSSARWLNAVSLAAAAGRRLRLTKALDPV